MNRASLAVVVLLYLTSAVAHADADSKRGKLLHLVELQGMSETIAAQLFQSKQQILEVARHQVAEMRENLPELPPEYWDTYEDAMAQLAAHFEQAISSAEATSLWAELYGQHVSESELDEIISYWESPIGRKDLAATRSASPDWQAEFAARATAGTNAALSEFRLFLKAEIEKLRSGGKLQ